MNDLNVRAIVAGSILDLMGSFFVGEILYALVAVASGAQTTDQLTTVFDDSVALQAAIVLIGAAMTAAGAYLAARIARGAERAHAFAVGLISTVIGFTIVFSAPESAPFWSQASALLLTIPAAFVGGELRRLQVGGKPAK